jgi:hypothetical protein
MQLFSVDGVEEFSGRLDSSFSEFAKFKQVFVS